MNPLGIATIIQRSDVLPDHWLWCRRHEQSHKNSEKCKCTCPPTGVPFLGGTHLRDCPRANDPRHCIDIGPFMSEREANRLASECREREWFPALGMEIEG